MLRFLNQTKLSSLVVAFLLPLLLPANSFAQTVHNHCDQKTWLSGLGQTDTPITIPGGPPRPNSIDWVVSTPSPPNSSVPNCNYEISDVTRAFVTLDFTGGGFGFKKARIIVHLQGVGTVVEGPFNFTSGVPLTIQFPQHQNPQAFEFYAPKMLVLALEDVTNTTDITINSTTARIGGNHYYVVPEPLTILGTGVVLGAIPVLKKEYAKRNKKKDKDA